MSSLLYTSCGIWAFWGCRLQICAVFSSHVNQLGLLCFRYISISCGQGTTCMQLWSYPQACFSLQSQGVAICSPLLSCLALFLKDSLLSTMFVTQQLPFQQILVEGDQQNPWTAILNAEKNLGTNFAKTKLGEVYFSICACKIVPWSQNNPRQTRINRRGIYSIKENAKGDHLKTINNYGNCRNYYRLLNLQSMYCYRNTYNPDALIVQCIVTPLKYSSTNFKQRHSREKCFPFSTSQK